MTPEALQYFARYNRWANTRLYESAGTLDDASRRADRGAFFGSIHNTLNHLIVADRIWLSRFEGIESPYDHLDAVPYDDFAELSAARSAEDERILALVEAMDGDALAAAFSYRNMAGVAHTKPLGLTLAHFFNHQTHHRGQIHAMLSMADADPPPLDLIYFLDEALTA